MTASPRPPHRTSRRTIVAAAGALGLTGTIAACEHDNGAQGGADTPDTDTSDTKTPDEETDTKEDTTLAGTADIPEGGGVVFEEAKVVVTQPETGEFKAFTAVCTHKGCVVREVSGGTINCACHGSRFAIADGSVMNGPATEPLRERALTVDGDTLRIR
jgi:Rieske Fe-S protein